MVYVYSKDNCPACELVKNKLESRGLRRGIDWDEKNINVNPSYMDEVLSLGQRSFPVVAKNEEVLFAGFRPDIIEQVL